ncbi:MAG: hypothetical protein DI535_15520 [Citrobacter freundii]|nr:MAG: hypothetical protein DI535_15520 [Citrobacter freundii]
MSEQKSRIKFSSRRTTAKTVRKLLEPLELLEPLNLLIPPQLPSFSYPNKFNFQAKSTVFADPPISAFVRRRFISILYRI